MKGGDRRRAEQTGEAIVLGRGAAHLTSPDRRKRQEMQAQRILRRWQRSRQWHQHVEEVRSSMWLVWLADLAHGRIVEPVPLFDSPESQDILLVRRDLALQNSAKASIFFSPLPKWRNW